MQFTNKLTKEDYNEFRKMTGADSNLVMLFFYPIGMAFAVLRLWRLTFVVLARDSIRIAVLCHWVDRRRRVYPLDLVLQRAATCQGFRTNECHASRHVTFTDTGLDCKGPAGAMTPNSMAAFHKLARGQARFTAEIWRGKTLRHPADFPNARPGARIDSTIFTIAYRATKSLKISLGDE